MKEFNKMIENTIRDTITESVAMNNEVANVMNVMNLLIGIYNRVTERGASRNEVSIEKIGKMINDLKLIAKKWQNERMW